MNKQLEPLRMATSINFEGATTANGYCYRVSLDFGDPWAADAAHLALKMVISELKNSDKANDSALETREGESGTPTPPSPGIALSDFCRANFAISTADPRFDPKGTITVNGFRFLPTSILEPLLNRIYWAIADRSITEDCETAVGISGEIGELFNALSMGLVG